MLPAPTILGDVTGDATGSSYLSINQEDVDLAQAYIDGNATLTFQQIANGDLNNDGMITQVDIPLLEELIASLQPPSPDPVADLLIDTSVGLPGGGGGDTPWGVIQIRYVPADNEIVVNICRDTPIDETGQTIEELYNSWVNTNQTIEGAIVTFVPMLLQEPYASDYQVWYNAAGDYSVNSIEKSTQFPGNLDHLNYYTIKLDAESNESFDEGWNLEAFLLDDQDGAYNININSAIGVSLYGDVGAVDMPFEPFEMMSTLNDSLSEHHGIYRIRYQSGYVFVEFHNATMVTSNNHYLGNDFYNINAQTLGGLINNSQDEYFVGLSRFRFLMAKNDEYYDLLDDDKKQIIDNLMIIFNATSWRFPWTSPVIGGSNSVGFRVQYPHDYEGGSIQVSSNGDIYTIDGQEVEFQDTSLEINMQNAIEITMMVDEEYWI
jgi:hypothetical protein